MKSMIVIVGPTGVGKTKLSIELAKKYNAEIISGDSMQIYKGMDIGTAKIKEIEKEGIIHHLLDIKEIDESYSVYNFQKDVRNKIEEIKNKNKSIIIVGGTGLYLKAVLYDYKFEAQENIKMKEYEDKSNEELLNLLKEIDEESALNIHINNRKRIIRAINIASSGKTKTINLKEQKHEPIYDFKMIGLTMDRKELYERINKRVDQMFLEGLLEEVYNVFLEHGDKKYQSLQGISYKELFMYFKNDISLDEAKELIKKNTRNYAKRQYTFFNNQFNVTWFNVDVNNFVSTIKAVENFLEN